MSAAPALPGPARRVAPGIVRRWSVPLGLLLTAAAVHAGSLAPSRAFFSRDLYSFWHPAVEVFVRAIGEGAWPLWNPYFGFGEPLFANPNFQLAYPPTWLNLLLPAGLYFKLFVLGHSVAGAWGVARLARRLRAARLGAFAAGAAWAAGGPLLSSIGMFHHFAAAAWMPWVLLALDRALRAPGARSAAVLAATAAGQALAGSADMCFMTALLSAAWTLTSLAVARRERGVSPALAATLAGAVVLAALLAAVQWLPAVALVPGTARSRPSPDASLYWSLHPLSLMDLVVPRLTTGAAATTSMGAAARVRLFESREPLLASIYLGMAAAVAAVVALARPRHRRSALILAAGTAVLVVAALGRHAPLLPAFLRLPGVAVFRFPPKYLLPALLLWSLLAGLGVDALARSRSRIARLRALGAGLAVAAVVLLAFTMAGLPGPIAASLADPLPAAGLLPHVRQSLCRAAVALALGAVPLLLAGRAGLAPRAAAAGLTALLVADLAQAWSGVNPAAPVALMRYRPPLLDSLGGAAPIRVYSIPHPHDVLVEQYVRRPAGWPPAAGWVLGSLDRLTAPVGARWRVLGSYDGDLTGLAAPALGRLSQWLGSRSDTAAAAVRLLQLGGVDYVVTLDPRVFGGVLEEAGRTPSVYRDPVRVLRTPDPLPKAFVAGRGLVIADEDAALQVLGSPAFDARGTVVLSASGPTPPAAPAPSDPAASEVRPLERRTDALAFEVYTRAPGYLVVLEAFDAAWTARVDGAPAAVLEANLLFRAVPVPAGRHRVEMKYRPRSVGWGALVSLPAWLLVLFKAGRLR